MTSRIVTLKPGQRAYFDTQHVENVGDSKAKLKIETSYHVTTRNPAETQQQPEPARQQ